MKYIRAEDLPEKQEEYTADFNNTEGIYSHTENGERLYSLPFNQGYNACRKEALEKVREVTEEDIASLMRKKAKEAGFQDNNLINPHLFIVLAKAIASNLKSILIVKGEK
jgi:hypothetical protein